MSFNNPDILFIRFWACRAKDTRRILLQEERMWFRFRKTATLTVRAISVSVIAILKNEYLVYVWSRLYPSVTQFYASHFFIDQVHG